MGLPNLDKLIEKCRALGYEPKAAGKRMGKDDCVQILRNHYLPKGGLPYVEVEPMLCFAEWNLKEHEQTELWQDNNRWVAQEKLNGCRLMLHAVEGKGWFAHSRTVSVKTFRFEELTDQLLLSDKIPPFSGTFDCEVMVSKPVDTSRYTSGGKGAVTKSSLHSTTAILHLEAKNARMLQVDQDAPLIFRIFDVLTWGGQNLKPQSLEKRLQVLEQVKDQVNQLEYSKWFDFPKVVRQDKKGFKDEILAAGGEGVILKNLHSAYEDSSSRSRTGWVKVKKRVEFDAFVTGFIRGDRDTAWKNMVGALEFSIMTEKGLHVLGYGTNLTLETRQKISIYDPETDKVSLHPGMLNKVAEISGQDVSARELRLSHCTIDRWRPKSGPDAKRREDCTTKYADLVEAANWVG